KDRLRQLAAETRGQADQPLGVLREQLAVDAGLVVIALEVRGADQLDEVAIAGVVAREQDEVVGVAVGPALTIVARARRHVHLAAEHGVDLCRARGGVEIDSPIEHAVVGDGDRGLPHRLGAVDEFLDARGAVKQRELTVRMQVGEASRLDLVAGGGWLLHSASWGLSMTTNRRTLPLHGDRPPGALRVLLRGSRRAPDPRRRGAPGCGCAAPPSRRDTSAETCPRRRVPRRDTD